MKMILKKHCFSFFVLLKASGYYYIFIQNFLIYKYKYVKKYTLIRNFYYHRVKISRIRFFLLKNFWTNFLVEERLGMSIITIPHKNI